VFWSIRARVDDQGKELGHQLPDGSPLPREPSMGHENDPGMLPSLMALPDEPFDPARRCRPGWTTGPGSR